MTFLTDLILPHGNLFGCSDFLADSEFVDFRFKPKEFWGDAMRADSLRQKMIQTATHSIVATFCLELNLAKIAMFLRPFR